jgi:bifunctional UDP-N-acetylglucosamine pyrophosphorylase/glucosamine-1-phosphate N-acetyltransferase
MTASTAAVVLAAGKGTRMRSPLPKVLQPLAGQPMLVHVLTTLAQLGFSPNQGNPPIVVVGHAAEQIMQTIGSGPRYVVQYEQRGTGDAARVGLAATPPDCDLILLVHGDEPLIEAATYRAMLATQQETDAAIVLLTGNVQETQGLGHVVRDCSGKIVKLVQENELIPEQQYQREINFGAYVFKRSFLEHALACLVPHANGEFYLTDVVAVASAQGLVIASVAPPHPDAQMGINDQVQLERAERYLQSNARVIFQG